MKFILIVYASLMIFSSCVSEKEEGVVVSDATLYSLSQNSSSYTYYKNDMDTLSTALESPHASYVRIRFNPKAISAMNDSVSNLEVLSFPDESMIVKEVYTQRGQPVRVLAIMYKLRNAANNGSGWIWAEIEGNGDVIYSAANKGAECVACHSQDDADLVRTFLLH